MDDEEYLKHYGVVGMRWGVRKNPSKAYRKSSKKAIKLDTKVDKVSSKRDKAQQKAYKTSSRLSKAQYKRQKASRRIQRDSILAPSAEKYSKLMTKTERASERNNKAQSRLSNLQAKTAKAERKAGKWKKSMSKAFRNVPISAINREDLEYGRRYVYMLKDDRF